MLLFLSGIILLILGYFTYGKFVEKIVSPSGKITPAERLADGVDFVILPKWKNMLIQLLNIAGVGPVIGVILGIKFGAIVFLIIPIGNIIGGAVHDYLCGMISIRHHGANLSRIIDINLGRRYRNIFTTFMVALLMLLITVFINTPANLINEYTLGNNFWIIAVCIFAYYIIATLFPVNTIIGRFYPFFGIMLLLGTAALFVMLIISGINNPELLTESSGFKLNKSTLPIIPVLFVTIACGIMSGFHATQSPIIARTISSEKEGRSVFYGMMVAEGVIAMVWAAGGLAIYNIYPEYMNINPNNVLGHIANYFLGTSVGALTIFAVIILAITSGDTALRSVRLNIADMLNLNQKPITNRLLVTVPVILIIICLLWFSNQSAKTFGILWNYFAWGNQVLAASTLIAASVWLLVQGKNFIITIIPGLFMTFIVTSFILWTSPERSGPIGFGLPLYISYAVAIIVCIVVAVIVHKYSKSRKNLILEDLNKEK